MDENNVINAKDIFETFKNDNEKKEFLEAQFNVVLDLQQKLKILEEENIHLKELLAINVPELDIPVPMIISPEEYLIDKQISLLEERSRTAAMAELTLEEVKKLDLLLKNKNIIKEAKEAKVITVKPTKGKLTSKELALIASSKKAEYNE